MTNATLDNSADGDLKSTILWQFDNAEHLVGIVNAFKSFFNASTKDLWDKLASEIGITSFNSAGEEEIPSTVSDFALACIGKLIGFQRPTLNYGTAESPDMRPMTSELYRKILVARWRLLNAEPSMKCYLDFLHYIFYENVDIGSNEDMGIVFHWWEDADLTIASNLEQKLALEQFGDSFIPYPTGVKSSEWSTSPVLGFEGQSPLKSYVVVDVTAWESGNTTLPQKAKIVAGGTTFSNPSAIRINAGATIRAILLSDSTTNNPSVKKGTLVTPTTSMGGRLNAITKAILVSDMCRDFNIETLGNGSFAWKQ